MYTQDYTEDGANNVGFLKKKEKYYDINGFVDKRLLSIKPMFPKGQNNTV